ncbi:mediator of RNA polymerase II transcription subunit 13-like [Octopus sinensis]|uniref:Mediator of RNA polymerase II transcription subunit 13 n=1 Tax=Octopus sinensis TaxID=2607531 RepID=A0A6P7U1Z4_9MOLL|nr:mediator of RNA polymerase II transcription subunit 13-like [Octopus sinensis]
MEELFGMCVDIPSPKPLDEPISDNFVLEQQPLAVGYYVTTARVETFHGFYDTERVPAGCACVLWAGLHFTQSQIYQSEAELISSRSPSDHPLDSAKTTDTLRYVLEQYNALSWLDVDLVTSHRRSGLPLHFQSLIRLGDSFNSLV